VLDMRMVNKIYVILDDYLFINFSYTGITLICDLSGLMLLSSVDPPHLTHLLFLLCTLQQRVRALLRGHDASCYGSTLVKDGNVCISWSSDCTVRYDCVRLLLYFFMYRPKIMSKGDVPCSKSSFIECLFPYFLFFRTWDVATASGICLTPLSIQRIPDFPILSTAWDADRSALYCGGGGGSSGGPSTGKGGRGFSFIGTPIHMLSIKDDF